MGLVCSSNICISSTFFFSFVKKEEVFPYNGHHHVSSVGFTICFFFLCCCSHIATETCASRVEKKSQFQKGEGWNFSFSVWLYEERWRWLYEEWPLFKVTRMWMEFPIKMALHCEPEYVKTDFWHGKIIATLTTTQHPVMRIMSAKPL